MKKISQAEAYRLRQRVAQLEKEKREIRNHWNCDLLQTARKLGFCVISVPANNGLLHYAVKV